MGPQLGLIVETLLASRMHTMKPHARIFMVGFHMTAEQRFDLESFSAGYDRTSERNIATVRPKMVLKRTFRCEAFITSFMATLVRFVTC
jgi:hypothetical protein